MPEFEIDVQRVVSVADEMVEALKTAVCAALAHEAVSPPAGLSLVLTDDAQLQQLNRQFRHINAPTDVLSFPAGPPTVSVPQRASYLGDIIISVPYAQRQAEAEGHSLLAELQLLAVHGVLHLLGHDHKDLDAKAKMWAAQTAVLQQLGVHIQLPDEENDGSEGAGGTVQPR